MRIFFRTLITCILLLICFSNCSSVKYNVDRYYVDHHPRQGYFPGGYVDVFDFGNRDTFLIISQPIGERFFHFSFVKLNASDSIIRYSNIISPDVKIASVNKFTSSDLIFKINILDEQEKPISYPYLVYVNDSLCFNQLDISNVNYSVNTLNEKKDSITIGSIGVAFYWRLPNLIYYDKTNHSDSVVIQLERSLCTRRMWLPEYEGVKYLKPYYYDFNDFTVVQTTDSINHTKRKLTPNAYKNHFSYLYKDTEILQGKKTKGIRKLIKEFSKIAPEYGYTIPIPEDIKSRNIRKTNLIQNKYNVTNSRLNSKQKNILKFCLKGEKSRTEIFEFLNNYYISKNNKNLLDFLIENNFLQMTDPDNPKSKNQKYYTTDLGKSVVY
jgi:hypothetical protein